ncbi:iron-siderophore ABC transporter substrate-binding protein [Mesorhizobium sp. SB112]|uniref:iron-siderophore ABC transporter substrate-binding protein n=1 Tax=Mesorhizobium sp. SB112 TaxID=3151853 RepID=UPI00326717F1
MRIPLQNFCQSICKKRSVCLRTLLLVLSWLCCASPAFAGCDGNLVTGNVLNAPFCAPGDPKRIVVLDPFYNLGMTMELGLPVVGAPLFGLHDPKLLAVARNAAVADIGDPKQPNLERIVLLRPDLIVGHSAWHEQIHESASRIAPTLLIDDLDWKAHFLLLAEATGRSETAREALANYEARVSAIKARMEEKTVSVVRIATSGFLVYLDAPTTFGPFAILREAGVNRTPFETSTGDMLFKRLDWEELEALESDVLLYFTVDGYDPAAYDRIEAETLANPFWQMLPAVQAGRAYRVDRATWMGFNGIASAHRVLDDVERYILTEP